MFRQLIAAALLALVHTPSAFGFDADKCDVYVFRTSENALWHCGSKLPGDSLYCDHSMGDNNAWPFPWASNHPDDWCDFMIATVRNGDTFPLTPQVEYKETPGPNIWWLFAVTRLGLLHSRRRGYHGILPRRSQRGACSICHATVRPHNGLLQLLEYARRYP